MANFTKRHIVHAAHEFDDASRKRTDTTRWLLTFLHRPQAGEVQSRNHDGPCRPVEDAEFVLVGGACNLMLFRNLDP